LNAYPAIKDSAVPLVGAIPGHWTTMPLKRWVRINQESLPETTAEEYEFRYLDIGSVGTGVLTQRPQKLRFQNAPSRARRVVHEGDTIVATVRTYLKAVYHIGGDATDLVCSTGFAVLSPTTRALPRFVNYLAQCSPFTERVTADSVGIAYPAIDETRLGSFHVAVPSIPEQAAIVRFLDHADRRIRRYIRAKQRLIKLLEEQTQTIIHHAVTRGLSPDVRLKPSGAEWLGGVPEHWRVVRLGNLLSERSETNDDGAITFVLSLLRQRGVIPYDEKGNIGNKKSDDITRYKIVRPGDIVVNCMNVIIGSVGLSSYTGVLSPVYYVLVSRRGNEPKYLNAIFQSPTFHRSLARIGNGILAHRMRIPMELLKCELLPCPPADEQRAIVRFLDEATAGLEATIAHARHVIDFLSEYRTRLIADVVTGKLDVREAAAGLPDEAAEGATVDEAGDLVGDEEGSEDALVDVSEEVEA